MTEHQTFLQRLFAMNPAILRSIMVGIFGIVTLVTGKAINDSVVDTVVNVILLVLPVVAGLVIRRAVTPNLKIIAYKPDPIELPGRILPGEATIDEVQTADLVDAAHSVPRAA